jgi:GTP-dependent phosphoenolpyruvate carboxykinase
MKPLQCIVRSSAWSFGHSDPDPSSVCDPSTARNFMAYILSMETILYLIEIGRTYLSNLRTHFALVFSSRRSIRWMWMNMATTVVVVAWGTLSTNVAWSATTAAFGSVNRLRDHEAGLTGLTRSRRWGRSWWITAVPVEATRHLLTF